MPKTYLQIAVPTPLRQLFTYTTTEAVKEKQLGARVQVSFGRRHLLGVIAAIQSHTDTPSSKLKAVEAVLDSPRVSLCPASSRRWCSLS